MAIIKGAKNAEVVPPDKFTWKNEPSARLQSVKVGDKDKGRKKSFSRKVARQATQEHVNEKSRQAAKGSNNKSKQPNPLRFANKVHRGITGTNSAFSTNKANLVFMGGMALIIASGASSHRLRDIFRDALNPNAAITSGNSGRLWHNIKIILVQLIWVIGLTFLSRLSNPLSNIFLVIISGMFLLWLIRNPQVFILLNAISEDGNTSTSSTTISGLVNQLNTSQSPLVNQPLYPTSLFPNNPNTSIPSTPVQPNPLAPNAAYQNVLNALKYGGGGGSRGVK